LVGKNIYWPNISVTFDNQPDWHLFIQVNLNICLQMVALWSVLLDGISCFT